MSAEEIVSSNASGVSLQGTNGGDAGGRGGCKAGGGGYGTTTIDGVVRLSTNVPSVVESDCVLVCFSSAAIAKAVVEFADVMSMVRATLAGETLTRMSSVRTANAASNVTNLSVKSSGSKEEISPASTSSYRTMTSPGTSGRLGEGEGGRRGGRGGAGQEEGGFLGDGRGCSGGGEGGDGGEGGGGEVYGDSGGGGTSGGGREGGGESTTHEPSSVVAIES